MSRRDVIAGAALGTMAAPAGARPGGSDRPVMAKVAFSVNGKRRELELDTRTSLLDAAREHLHGARAVTDAAFAGSRPTAENAFKLKLAERALGAVMSEARG